MLNKTIIQGRLTRDVELRQTQTGTNVALFTVAWSDTYKGNERKLFMPCVAWSFTGEFIANYFSKGQEICVEGYLTSRQWEDSEGNKREVIELTVDKAHFCGKREDTNKASATNNDDNIASFDTDEFIPIDSEEGLPF